MPLNSLRRMDALTESVIDMPQYTLYAFLVQEKEEAVGRQRFCEVMQRAIT